MVDWTEQSCKACEGGVPILTKEEVAKHLDDLSGWSANDNSTKIKRVFEFKNYYRTMAFVNAIAWMTHRENHHPDLEVGYNKCVVNYMTHAINGLSENDIICAHKVDVIYKQGQA